MNTSGGTMKRRKLSDPVLMRPDRAVPLWFQIGNFGAPLFGAVAGVFQIVDWMQSGLAAYTAPIFAMVIACLAWAATHWRGFMNKDTGLDYDENGKPIIGSPTPVEPS